MCCGHVTLLCWRHGGTRVTRDAHARRAVAHALHSWSGQMSSLRHTAIAVIGIGLPAFASLPTASADTRLPMMDPELPVICARDTQDQIWRLQCDARTKTCL